MRREGSELKSSLSQVASCLNLLLERCKPLTFEKSYRTWKSKTRCDTSTKAPNKTFSSLTVLNSTKHPRDFFRFRGGGALERALKLSLESNQQMLKQAKICRQKIRQQLPQHHKILAILADGNCLFRALSTGLSAYNQVWSHSELRSKCVDVISTHPTFVNRFMDQFDHDNYIHKMQCDGEYGDELCIQALAHELNLSIRVYSPDYPVQSFGDHLHPSILLAYNGSNHFDLIHQDRNHTLSNTALECIGEELRLLHNGVTQPRDPKVIMPIHDVSSHATTNLCLVSSNVTSLRKNWPLLQQTVADVYLCQETTLNTHGQNSMQRSLSSQGFSAAFGPATKHKFSGSQKKISLWNACSGGLATIAKQSVPFKAIPCDGDSFIIGKSHLNWFPTGVGRRGFYVYNIYGFVGAGPKCLTAFEKNEQLLHEVFSHAATLGNSPILFIGDFQTSPDHSPTLGTLLHSGTYHDLGAIWTNSAWTYQRGADSTIQTRIDLAVCNSEMLPHIKLVEVLDGTGLPSHRPIRVQFSFTKTLDHKFVYRSPKPVDFSTTDEQTLIDTDALIWDKQMDDFTLAFQNLPKSKNIQRDINNLFHQWTTLAEETLLIATKHTSRKFQGRGLFPRLVKTIVAAPPLDERTGAANFHFLSLSKLQRRLKQLSAKLMSVSACDSTFQKQLHNLCSNIDHSWNRILPDISIPQLHVAEDVQQAIKLVQDKMQEESKSISQTRLQSFKQFLIADWQKTRSATYRWVRDVEPFVLPVFKTAEHEYAVKHHDLHNLMFAAWYPIFNKYTNREPPQFDSFLEQFPVPS